MPFYSVLEVTPTAEDWIPNYLEHATQMVVQHGGTYLARTASHEILEGDSQAPALRVIIQWGSKAEAEAFMNDPAYAPLLAARSGGSISHHCLIEGKDDFA
jgi:uncharacterized protein (DUF1330 family)